MKKYDFLQAIKLINENLENLKSASLGMHEDWYWTSETIWVDGVYVKELLADSKIAGINGSSWATPTLSLNFKDGSEKMIEVSEGETNGSKPVGFELGFLSQFVQDGITPLS